MGKKYDHVKTAEEEQRNKNKGRVLKRIADTWQGIDAAWRAAVDAAIYLGDERSPCDKLLAMKGHEISAHKDNCSACGAYLARCPYVSWGEWLKYERDEMAREKQEQVAAALAECKREYLAALAVAA